MMRQHGLRYGIVSVICMVLNVSLVTGLSWAGLHYAVACTIAFAIVAVTGFALHSCWTFDVAANWPAFMRYAGAMALNLPLSIFLIWLGHDVAGLAVGVAAAVATAFLVAWNYIASRWALGAHKGTQP